MCFPHSEKQESPRITALIQLCEAIFISRPRLHFLPERWIQLELPSSPLRTAESVLDLFQCNAGCILVFFLE